MKQVIALMEWFNPLRWALLLAFAGALILGYFAWVDHIGDAREAKVVARYAAQAKQANDARAAVAAPLAAKQEARQVQIRTVTKTIIKEVPTYVSINDCPMSPGFRLLHDAAANGVLPDASGIANAAAVPAQDVANTTAENYGTCHQTAERLKGLQDWVRAQAALKN